MLPHTASIIIYHCACEATASEVSFSQIRQAKDLPSGDLGTMSRGTPNSPASAT